MTEYIKILDIGAKTGLGTYKGYIHKKICKKADEQLSNTHYKYNVTLIYKGNETIHLSSNAKLKLEWEDSTEEAYNLQEAPTLKCRSKIPIWNLKHGDITAYKIEKGIYYFLYVDESNNSIGWDTWMDDGNEEFLKYFELIDIDPSIIKPNYDYLIPLLKENNIV